MQVKLTNNEIRQIKDEFYSGKKQKEIAQKYNITQGHVSNIVNGRKWSEFNMRKIEGATKINIIKGNGYMKIEIDGHNEDTITCAGISAIIQTCELGLKALAEGRKNVIIKEYDRDLDNI